LIAASICSLICSHALAQPAPSAAIELNKLETLGENCRAYLVVQNAGGDGYASFKLDMVMFQTDGVIGKRFALELAPLRPSRKAVKIFDLSGVRCDSVGSFLINDVTECRLENGSQSDCFAGLTVSSLTKSQLTK
jgi:hypothetical protein